jgi:hypothetical protein
LSGPGRATATRAKDALTAKRPSPSAHTSTGNHRGATAVRGGKDGEPRFYNLFGPKVLAGIDAGRLPDTIADRAIHVLMERKARTVRLERVRRRVLVAEVENLRDGLDAWAHRHVEQLADYNLPERDLDALSDRAEEGWEPLLAVATLAGAGDAGLGWSDGLRREYAARPRTTARYSALNARRSARSLRTAAFHSAAWIPFGTPM